MNVNIKELLIFFRLGLLKFSALRRPVWNHQMILALALASDCSYRPCFWSANACARQSRVKSFDDLLKILVSLEFLVLFVQAKRTEKLCVEKSLWFSCKF
jgi:hypothetical protein